MTAKRVNAASHADRAANHLHGYQSQAQDATRPKLTTAKAGP
jgi:antirestriction protein ArdC